MSYWGHRKSVQRVRAVATEDMARAAVDLLGEGGLRALTVRAVAQRLGVAPASLYSRISAVDDLFDLALDDALGRDHAIEDAIEDAGLHELMHALYRHLVRHRWATQVIATRAPRGPNYLKLSERMVVLIEEAGAADPLTVAYALSNFVIGSAATAPVVGDERASPIDSKVAPLYARLHGEHVIEAESVVVAGVAALYSHLTLTLSGD